MSPRGTPTESAGPEFSADWFSGNLFLFDPLLRHLRGTPCRILEVGSFEGRSIIWMLGNVATHPDATITSVDLDSAPRLRRNVALTPGGGKVTFHMGRSRDILPTLERSAFDFIYIDGSHEKVDVLEDAVLCFRLARIGAIIAFDDYFEAHEAWNETDFAKPAIDAFLHVYDTRIEVLERSHQIWVRKLRDDPPR